jgi:signal transduction histidine kinase
VDVEGDPSELAAALAAVLDNALALKERHPSLVVRVHVRGSPGHVTFEVSDDLGLHAPDEVGEGPVSDRPFLVARGEGSLGVGLARARLLVERHGGELLSRRTDEGSCVQLTLPRRRSRGPRGLA